MYKTNASKDYWEYWEFQEVSGKKTSLNFESRLRRFGFHLQLHQWFRAVFWINHSTFYFPNVLICNIQMTRVAKVHLPGHHWDSFVFTGLWMSTRRSLVVSWVQTCRAREDILSGEESHKIQARNMRERQGYSWEIRAMGNHPNYCSLFFLLILLPKYV